VATKVRRDIDFIGTRKLVDPPYRLCSERPRLSPGPVSVETLNSKQYDQQGHADCQFGSDRRDGYR